MDPKGSMTNGTRICGICQRSTSWLSYASSPAFAIDDYDFKNETYSTWTESQWTIFSGRIFLKQSPGLDQGFLATGIIVFLFSLFFVSAAYFAHILITFTVTKASHHFYRSSGEITTLRKFSPCQFPVQQKHILHKSQEDNWTLVLVNHKFLKIQMKDQRIQTL